jgi:hypothetical protein
MPSISILTPKFYSSYCVLFIVIPGLVFLAVGLWNSDIQFLRLSDCEIDSSTHVAVVLHQSYPAIGALDEVKQSRKFVLSLQRGQGFDNWASFDFLGVRYVQVVRFAMLFVARLTIAFVVDFKEHNIMACITQTLQLPSGSSSLFSSVAAQLMTGSSLAQVHQYAQRGKSFPRNSNDCTT